MTVSQVDDRRAEARSGGKGTLSFTPVSGKRGAAELETSRGQMPTMVHVSLAEKPNGTLFLLTSLRLVSPGENKLLRAFQEKGWTIVMVTPCLDIVSLTQIAVPSERSPSLLGKQINQHLAERAYAAESAWEFLCEQRPDHRALPKVVCGISLGALASPAVALRLPDPAALISIGGGAHVPAIMANSSLRLLTMPTASTRRSLSDQMLNEVTVDPAFLGHRLGELPVLLIDGRFDTIIPGRFADSWHHSLANADRWRYPVGHLLLIEGIMPFQADRILNWITSVLPNN